MSRGASSLWPVVLSAWLCAGCGGESTQDGNSHAEPLCDGSPGVRFLLTAAGGFEEPATVFTNPFGHSLLVVTGTCEAFVGEDYMEGLRTLTLTAQQADALASDVRRSQIASFAGHEDQGCPDAGRVSISDGSAFAWCSCGCDPDAPAGLESAMDAAHEWRQTLWAQGMPLAGAVAAAAEPDLNPMPDVPHVPWPLPWAVDTLPSPQTGAAGQRVEDASEVAVLRKLRLDARKASSYIGYVPVETASAAQYQLFVRDELPEPLASALTALLAH